MNSSKHFKLRVKSRLGISKSNTYKYLNRVEKGGIPLEDTTSKPRLNLYLNSIIKPFYKHNRHILLYNRHVIIYGYNNICITVLDVPKEYYGSIESLKKKRGVM